MDEQQTNIPVKKYHKIGEVAKMLDVPASTLRFWEKEFRQIKPMKSKKGDRIYSLKDIEILREIKYLTHDKGIKISKASKKIKKENEDENPKYVLVKKLREMREMLMNFKNSLE
jgi:DNA-binding transcriptional MerR regulator